MIKQNLLQMVLNTICCNTITTKRCTRQCDCNRFLEESRMVQYNRCLLSCVSLLRRPGCDRTMTDRQYYYYYSIIHCKNSTRSSLSETNMDIGYRHNPEMYSGYILSFVRARPTDTFSVSGCVKNPAVSIAVPSEKCRKSNRGTEYIISILYLWVMRNNRRYHHDIRNYLL